jgi:hypothetical protein
MKLLKYTTFSLVLMAFWGCGSNNNSTNYDLKQLTPAQYLPVTTQCTCKSKIKKASPAPASTKNNSTATPKPAPSKTPVPQKEEEPDKTLSMDEAARIIYFKAVDKLHSMQNFKTSLHHFSKGNFVKLKPVKETKFGTSTNYVVFQRPRKMFFKIVESIDSPSLNNTRLVIDGSEKLKIKVPGILGIFTFTYDVDSPDLSSYRGYSLYDIDMVTLETRLDNKSAKVKMLGLSKVDGEEVYMLEVTNIKMTDNKITKEKIAVRKKDFVLNLEEMYEGDDMVFQNRFENYVYNVQISADDFKI